MALVEDGVVVAEESVSVWVAACGAMVPAIDGICRSLGWAAEDIGEIYVSAGPGSFTGLRIGITLAKTLAFVTGAKIVAVPSVLVVVQNVSGGRREAMVVMDAKRAWSFLRLAFGAMGWREMGVEGGGAFGFAGGWSVGASAGVFDWGGDWVSSAVYSSWG